ncbi:hypothetical protein KSX_56780 [Ktedonospora formicarum]|uniref:Uncharacterized protein n=1 Tax=Ktedonospora formicarum TaxID=2778364 RepID=A0A8J3MTU2_9CHLR|nr:hypothetical protein KSX_56780 [Ktedonospora formicarum]
MIQNAQDRFHAILSPQQDCFKQAETRASEVLEQRFGNRKHLQHLQWLFALGDAVGFAARCARSRRRSR